MSDKMSDNWIIRYKTRNRWKKIRKSSGEVRKFSTKPKARQYCRNHLNHVYDEISIEPLNETKDL